MVVTSRCSHSGYRNGNVKGVVNGTSEHALEQTYLHTSKSIIIRISDHRYSPLVISWLARFTYFVDGVKVGCEHVGVIVAHLSLDN